MTPKLRVGLGAFLISLPLDQLTKLLVERNLIYGQEIRIIEGFFSLTHVRNTGAAFGLLAGMPEPLRLAFFGSISVIAIFIVLSFFRNLAPGDRLPALALGLILGGTVGNLIDRVFRREVVDFLHFKLWGGRTWPDFNVADSCIVVGVGVLALELLSGEGQSDGLAEREDPNG